MQADGTGFLTTEEINKSVLTSLGSWKRDPTRSRLSKSQNGAREIEVRLNGGADPQRAYGSILTGSNLFTSGRGSQEVSMFDIRKVRSSHPLPSPSSPPSLPTSPHLPPDALRSNYQVSPSNSLAKQYHEATFVYNAELNNTGSDVPSVMREWPKLQVHFAHCL
jgi:hypothetical protein